MPARHREFKKKRSPVSVSIIGFSFAIHQSTGVRDIQFELFDHEGH